MHRKFTAQLPPKPAGETRNFSIEHTWHSDISFSFWDGTEDPTGLLEEGHAEYKTYNMSHTLEGLFMAALLGYTTRLQTPDDEMRAIFDEARTVIAYKHIDVNSYDRVPHAFTYVASGEPMSTFDDNSDDRKWEALTLPISPVPGTSQIHGTEFFTDHTQQLVIARITDERNDNIVTPIECVTFLKKSDVSPIATAIAKLSLGESATHIKILLDTRFGEQ